TSRAVIHSLSLHDALPIYVGGLVRRLAACAPFAVGARRQPGDAPEQGAERAEAFKADRIADFVNRQVGGTQQVFGFVDALLHQVDRKSTRLNSSHVKISYA